MRNNPHYFVRAQAYFRRAVEEEALARHEHGFVAREHPPRVLLAPIPIAVMADAFGTISQGARTFPRPNTQIRLGAMEFADFLKWSHPSPFVRETGDLTNQGVAGFLWGAIVILDPEVPQGQIVAMSEGDAGELDPSRMIVIEVTR